MRIDRPSVMKIGGQGSGDPKLTKAADKPSKSASQSISTGPAAARDSFEKAQGQNGLNKLFDVFRPGTEQSGARKIVEPEDRTANPRGVIGPTNSAGALIRGKG